MAYRRVRPSSSFHTVCKISAASQRPNEIGSLLRSETRCELTPIICLTDTDRPARGGNVGAVLLGVMVCRADDDRTDGGGRAGISRLRRRFCHGGAFRRRTGRLTAPMLNA